LTEKNKSNFSFSQIEYLDNSPDESLKQKK
jgi:hypothetical protein